MFQDNRKSTRILRSPTQIQFPVDYSRPVAVQYCRFGGVPTIRKLLFLFARQRYYNFNVLVRNAPFSANYSFFLKKILFLPKFIHKTITK